jgi:hypothetical protein
MWVSAFLDAFVGCLVFYTNDAGLSMFPALRHKPNIHPRVTYSHPFDIPCVRNLSSKYEAQLPIDGWRSVHNANLFAVWNGRTCLLKEVSDEFPTAVTFWIDSGSLREPIYRGMSFPDNNRLKQLFPRGTDGKMVYAFFHGARPKRIYPVRAYHDVYAIGGFYGGDHRAIKTFFRVFWKMHLHFLEKGDFVGCDQSILNAIVVYSGPFWIQPNYLARRCNRWFATFSFYGNTKLCFDTPPPLYNSTKYVRGQQLRWDPLSF